MVRTTPLRPFGKRSSEEKARGAVMRAAKQHQFQLLTKRAERLAELAPQLDIAPNVWMGVSIESQAYTHRVELLRRVAASIRFLSVKPLLGPIEVLPLAGIQWVILGGESGHHARPMDPGWVRSIRDQCRQAKVPFFFKQWGGVIKSRAGRTLDGRTWDEIPRGIQSLAKAPAPRGSGRVHLPVSA